MTARAWHVTLAALAFIAVVLFIIPCILTGHASTHAIGVPWVSIRHGVSYLCTTNGTLESCVTK